jgi:HAD superfamily hydrolase (TIGR01459 family)
MTETKDDHRLVEGLRHVAGSYDVVLCDVWGVVHDGMRVFAAAADALARFRAGGGTVVLITNAPRPKSPILRQLDEFGAPRDAYDAVVTSGDVTLALMAERGPVPLHHIGPARDFALLEEFDRMVPGTAPRVGLDQADYVLCTGLFDDETETPEDYDPALEVMLRRGLTMICANPDMVVHRGDQLLYCAGALAARYTSRGGTAIYAGKPHRPIYLRALEAAERIRRQPIAQGRVLAIGDGLRTDIAGAVSFGIDSLFVLGGIHRDDFAGPDGLFDRRRYADFIAAIEQRPIGAIHELVW